MKLNNNQKVWAFLAELKKLAVSLALTSCCLTLLFSTNDSQLKSKRAFAIQRLIQRRTKRLDFENDYDELDPKAGEELVSVILVAHKFNDQLIMSLRSVLLQDYQSIELVFVDNSPGKSSREIA